MHGVWFSLLTKASRWVTAGTTDIKYLRHPLIASSPFAAAASHMPAPWLPKVGSQLTKPKASSYSNTSVCPRSLEALLRCPPLESGHALFYGRSVLGILNFPLGSRP